MDSAPLGKKIKNKIIIIISKFLSFQLSFFVETQMDFFIIIIQLQWMGTEAFKPQKYIQEHYNNVIKVLYKTCELYFMLFDALCEHKFESIFKNLNHLFNELVDSLHKIGLNDSFTN